MNLPEIFEFSRQDGIQRIEAFLRAAGWVIQPAVDLDSRSSLGIAVRSLTLSRGHGTIDYLLFVDQKAAGVIEVISSLQVDGAEREKEHQVFIDWEALSEKVRLGLPFSLPVHMRPLPFFYQCSGIKIAFRNGFDPSPRARNLSAFHKPETLKNWLEEGIIGSLPRDMVAASSLEYGRRGATLQERVWINMPPLIENDLRPVQAQTIHNIERSLRENRPRTLVQMSSDSGKTRIAISLIDRLIRFAGMQRVLFLADCESLCLQTRQAFHQYVSPYTNEKFGEKYPVECSQNGTIDPVAQVCISTPQNAYIRLKRRDSASSEKLRISTSFEYHPDVPIETFDVIVLDGCSHIADSPCRDVIEYFDAFVMGLCATREKQVVRFFNENLVMEYGDEPTTSGGKTLKNISLEALLQAIADGEIEEDLLGGLAARLSRMVYWLSAEDEVSIRNASVVSSGLDMVDRQVSGLTLKELSRQLIEVLSLNLQEEKEVANLRSAQELETTLPSLREKKIQKAVAPFQSFRLREILLVLNKKMCR